MASAPYTVKWGILATGGIAQTFAKDLLADPGARGVSDVRHEVVAAASSSSRDRAVQFLQEVGAGSAAKAYGSYAELVVDPDVDIVYVATPHGHHFQNVMLALELGNKHVLCEKAFTVNAAQARKLVATARARNRFLMEAVWTRYFPLSVQVRDLVQSGAIGTVYRVVADNSLNNNTDDPDKLAFPDSNRMVNKDLAGGALLDLGIYSLTWLFQILYHLQTPTGTGADRKKEAPRVLAACNPYVRTGADEQTTVVLQFPQHHSQGVAMTSMRVGTGVNRDQPSGPAILIQGSEGEIQVMGPAYKPLQYRVFKRIKDADGSDAAAAAAPKVVDLPIPKDTRPGVTWQGHGMFWEADEAARCLRDGKSESATLPLEESIVIMETMEEALRQGGITYPDVITTDVYDKDSPLNTGKPVQA
ncbi:NAD(P)-binding domain protein [Niveomyces insectorum RCEF 264]|uniref:D-xylose 1-dehydrogenase (NADP(+), D-xylono-1,5-lactone-forming) n=1 Tax=Niveomyces insectorum RCEF 264 TaxID=1081102 RepID=A0A167YMG1_9HYPO|nr:NAD(P)-binding domain protein [Niveomyces insectorum RCEF 264]